MLRVRAVVVLGVVLVHLGLVATTAWPDADFAWAPSYFDGDDGDFLPLLLSEPAPTAADLVRGWQPTLTAVTAVAVWPPRGRSRLAVARTRLRAPPLR